jgi:tetratricopeptide (TPR) repeat protein
LGSRAQFRRQPLQAKALFEQAIRISSADGGDTGVSPTVLNNFAHTLSRLNRNGEAAGYTERAYVKAGRAGDEMVIIQSLLGRAEAYLNLGDFARAASIHAEVEPRLKELLAPGHFAFASLAGQKSLLAQGRHDFSAALGAVDKGIAILESHKQNARHLPLCLLHRANLYVEMHRDAEAQADAARALQLTKDMTEPNLPSPELGAGYLILGQALLAQGEFNQANAAFASAHEHLLPTLGPDHPQTLTAAKLAAELSVNRSK